MGEHGGSDTGTWGCLSSFILFLIDRGKWILRKLLYYRYTIDALDFFLSFVAAGIDEVNCWKTRLSLALPGYYQAYAPHAAVHSVISPIQQRAENLVITDGTKMEPAGMFFVSVAMRDLTLPSNAVFGTPWGKLQARR